MVVLLFLFGDLLFSSFFLISTRANSLDTDCSNNCQSLCGNVLVSSKSNLAGSLWEMFREGSGARDSFYMTE